MPPEATTALAADPTDTISDRETARRVLATEAAALLALADSLDDNFAKAVELLESATGRIVVTGMGKSGHVGRKIASTLASTGAPSLFVHPAEASHGDLGMVVLGDAVLALSNSGETSELADLVAHCRRFGIPLVAITARSGSTLAAAADVALLLPAAPEACPMGLAPTTSTTMQIALGDAIAVALLRRRGFTAQDFRQFHPGGRLGQRLRRVRDIMHIGEEVPLATADTSMDQALIVMTAKRFGCVGIVGPDGTLAGIVTDGDVRRAMAPDMLTRRAGELMTKDPRTIGPEALADEALRAMNAPDRRIAALFVVDADRKPVGVVHLHDLLRVGQA